MNGIVASSMQANVINEIARILKPGGKVIIVDATQPEFDGADVCTLDGLPSWGEMTPVYKAYLKSDVEYDLIKVSTVHDSHVDLLIVFGRSLHMSWSATARTSPWWPDIGTHCPE